MKGTIAEITGKKLSLSNLEKELYPDYGFTKAHVLEYYRLISKFILPHLEGRALTLKRYPDGVEKGFFFEKRCPAHRPSWVATAQIPQDKGSSMTVCLVNDLNTLIWVENFASLELHVPLAKARSPEIADSVVFDLDPGDGTDILDCAGVALILRDLFARLKLSSYIKTSGMKGLHVYVPLNNERTTFEETKQFSKSVAEVIEHNYPDLVTARMAKEQRKRRIFINWSQNDSSKTMICVYSLRAREKPFVSFPLTWDELETLSRQGDPGKLQVLHSEALIRTGKNGDLFQDLMVRKQKLPHL